MVNVAVIILNWNRPEDTLEVLNDLKKADTNGLDVKVFVVDNHSTDDSASRLRAFKLGGMSYHFIQNKENLGFAEGNNVGIRYALKENADYVLVLNNDTRLSKNLLVQLIEFASSDPKIAAVSPKIYFARGFEFKDNYKKSELGKVIWYAGGVIDWNNVYGSTRGVDKVDDRSFDRAEETDFATGTCLLLKSTALSAIGLFDQKYYLYYEDTDLSVRLKHAGFKVIYLPSVHIWHKVAQSSGIGSNLNDYFITRNRLLFGMRYASVRTKFALLRESAKMFFTGRAWQRIGVRDFYVGRFGKGSWK